MEGRLAGERDRFRCRLVADPVADVVRVSGPLRMVQFWRSCRGDMVRGTRTMTVRTPALTTSDSAGMKFRAAGDEG